MLLTHVDIATREKKKSKKKKYRNVTEALKPKQ